MDKQSAALFTTELILFFDRVSDALYSTTSMPSSLATKCAVVVLPTPGGPDSSAARSDAPVGSSSLAPMYFAFGRSALAQPKEYNFYYWFWDL